MQRSAWTTPFGLAFIVGSAAALVAGYATGSGMRDAGNMTVPMYNMGNMANTLEPEVDENALIAANREPPPQEAAPPPAPATSVAPPPPAANEVQAAPPPRRQAEPVEPDEGEQLPEDNQQ